MSKIENSSIQIDIYSVWKNNAINFYSGMQKSIPEFHQASTNLIQEYVQSWNNFATSVIDIQREIATRAGIKSSLPDATLNVMNDSAANLNKSLTVQNKISVASIDAAKQNIRTWNENSSTFANLGKNIVNSLFSSTSSKI
jgi:hypothetical protein